MIHRTSTIQLRAVLVPFIVLVSSLAGCSSPTSPSGDLRGGVLATFEVSGERFKTFVTNPTTVQALFALQAGGNVPSIPNGRIRRGPGLGNHNAPYSWYLDAADMEMAAFTIELCDGRPSYVEAHVGEYVDVIGRYCPWGARLVALQDLR